jgi:hypothetical protein
MGRKKVEPDPMDEVPLPDDGTLCQQIIEFLNQMPPMVKGGKPNIDHYRARAMRLSTMVEVSFAPGSKLPSGHKQALDALMFEAKLAGFDEKQVLDFRSEADKNQEIVDRLEKMPSSVLEWGEDEIAGIEKSMDQADRLVEEVIDRRINNGEIGRVHGTNKEKPPPKSPRLKQWRNLLHRLKKVRFRAKTPIPIEGRRYGLTPNRVMALQMGHLLRFMSYVGRSNIADRMDPKHPGASCFTFGSHHADLAIDLWLAETKQEIVGTDKLAPHDSDGVLAAMSPGHGKSEVGAFWAAKRICVNPYTCGIVLHRQYDLARDIVEYIKKNFQRDNPQGRRCMSLYPLQLSAADNGSGTMRIQIDRVLKQATLTAFGIAAKFLGTGIDFVMMDDVVDQEIAQQPEMRESVFNRINGTVFGRLRGSKTMTVTLCNLWHYDDPNMRRIKNPGSTRVLVRNCGGPPNFKPLWPEVYGVAYLRRRYEQMRNPQLYAALYMCNPMPDEARVIKCLRLYDPLAPEHQKFLRGGVSHLSIDPSATDNARSDKAAWIHAAEGTLIVEKPTDHGNVTESERQLRILAADQFLSTQIALVDKTQDYCLANKIDRVHVEVAAAFRGVAEMFRNKYGLEVIQHVPAKYSKAQRIKMAAPLIEDGNASRGLRAVVLFPGVRDEATGELGIDPKMGWLANQIIDFGVHPDDHAVDALSQLVNYLAADLGVGRGLASAIMARSAPLVDEFKKRLADLWASGDKKANDMDDEARFLSRNWE